MFRQHWHEPRFWLWWLKKRAPAEVRWGFGYIGVLAALGAGFLVADRLSQVSPGNQAGYGTGSGAGVVKTSGNVRIVTHPVVRYVPVVKKSTITVAGNTRVADKTVLVPAIRTETQTITSDPTVANQRSSTVVRVVVTTLPVTVEQTTTQSMTIVSTQTLPGQTVTTTHTVTQQVTTPAVALTVTLPSTTLAITVP